jgi:hypothetical protein
MNEIRLPLEALGQGCWIPEDQISVRDAYIKDYFKFLDYVKARHRYDLGDGWEHDVTLEKILPAVKGTEYPKCLAGKNRCPPD